MKYLIWHAHLTNMMGSKPAIPITSDLNEKDRVFFEECLDELSSKNVEDLYTFLCGLCDIVKAKRK